jgi:hypothetical protein
MSSQKIPDYIDDHSFDIPPLRAANDPTGVPNFPPEEGRGNDFQPFNLSVKYWGENCVYSFFVLLEV